MNDPASDRSRGLPVSDTDSDKKAHEALAREIAREVPAARRLDEADRERIVDVVVSRTDIVAGPIPSPAILRGYAEVDPALPDRIMRMAEVNQAHLVEMDRRTLELEARQRSYEHTYAMVGQVFGLVSVALTLAVVAYTAVNGQPAVASIIGGVGIAALATAFIVGRRNAAAPPEEKPDDQSPASKPTGKRRR
jgi:uncharacterized membrane protein